MFNFDSIFENQKKFQRQLNQNTDSQDYFNTMSLAQIAEIMESLNETPWKPWKKQQTRDIPKLQKELADELLFFINRCIFAGLDPQGILELANDKIEENYQRQANQY